MRILLSFSIAFILGVSFVNGQRPNILWIVAEDIGPDLSFYGDGIAKTPNLDLLASEGIVFENVFATVGVCAPSRSSIITGMYPTTIGTMHMRTGKDISSWGNKSYNPSPSPARLDTENNSVPEYSAVIPKDVKCFTEYMRAAGYFCTNNSKTDYQFAAPLTSWDENNASAHWRNRNYNQPFFSVFNINLTHESRLWTHNNKALTVSANDVVVPPYLEDNEITRKDIARHYSNIELMDKQVGKIITQLKEDNLYKNTIIFFYSDHGGPLPREKREIYDTGLKVPMVVKPITTVNSKRNTDLISFVDLAPTILSLAEIKPPKYMVGKPFLGVYKKETNDYIFGSSDRFDGFSDRSRMIRTKDYLYVKNYFPEKTKYKDVAYRKQIPSMNSLLESNQLNKLNKHQKSWFEPKANEELYNINEDPYQLNNVIENEKYVDILKKMRKQFDKHQKKYPDLGEISELEMLNEMWPNLKQPETSVPKVKLTSSGLRISCDTEGASIAYIISNNLTEKFDNNSDWQLYSKPLPKNKGKYLFIVAERIGYKQSQVVIHKL